MILTGRTGLAALMGVLAIMVSPWPATSFAVLLTALAVAVVIDAGLAASPKAVRFDRFGAASARLGESVDAGLVLRNDGRRRFRGHVRDAWAPSARAQPRVHTVELAPGQTRRIATRLRPVRRGTRRSAGVTARSIGPLGLAGRQRSQPVSGQIRILPPFISRKHLPSRLAKLRDIEGQLPTLTRGHGTEFDSLREYVVGDDVRSIDWRATARRADVVVRTWRPERDRRVVIVLDTGRTAAAASGSTRPPATPAAGRGWTGRSMPRCCWPRSPPGPATTSTSSPTTGWPGPRCSGVTHRSACPAGRRGRPLEPALLESDWHAMVSAILLRARRRALVVLLTDLNAAALDEGLLPVLPQLSARHQVIVAAVADPRVDQLASGRSDAAAVYDAAAAERARNDRHAIAARLRRRGVEVVDASPEELAPALTDHYLTMKATGRL
ncbi:hypothetical protein I553_3796 [Mycobacterium xenopi 4042]|uniref:DUF58 domain-containing protein n=1 Tax=Mycobacterium xenopi 4042 TaxID=1299334 RepID=X8EVS2_MYCXE|nr:hypothetical protein I553_3796 [Mycobacterium xenopi 4042]